MDNKLVLSRDGKIKYLQKLSKDLIKILRVIETEEDAVIFIDGILFEVNASNILFDGELVKVVVKLVGIARYKQDNLPFKQIRQQIFEAKGIVDRLSRQLQESAQNGTESI